MDFTNMNMNTGFFSWIISVDIHIRALENLPTDMNPYEYVRFS